MRVIQLITFFLPEGNQVCLIYPGDIRSMEIMEYVSGWGWESHLKTGRWFYSQGSLEIISPEEVGPSPSESLRSLV